MRLRQFNFGKVLIAAVALHIGFTWWNAVRLGRRARRSLGATEPDVEGVEPFVSVLVPAWNEAGTIEQCLEALSQIDYSNYETIVIAGGTDGTYEIVERRQQAGSPIKLIQQPPGGKNAALALGLTEAQGEVIAVLDADSVVDPAWLRCLIRPISAGASAVSGNFLPRRDTWITAYEQMERIDAYRVRGSRALQGSGSIAITRSALDTIGGFPADVPVGVDWDLGVRLSRAGLSVAFAPDANLSTDRPASWLDYWRNEVRWRRGHLWSLWHHRRWFFRNRRAAVGAAAFHLVTMAVIAGAIAPGVALLFRRRSMARTLLNGEGIFLLLVAGRRAALAAEIAAFTGNPGRTTQAWAAVLLLFTSMAATIRAAATLGRLSPYFKGPRSSVDSRSATPATGQFNPYAIESHYSLDMACYLLHREQPRTVRICSHDPAIVEAAVRRLAWVEGDLFAETADLARAVNARLGTTVRCQRPEMITDAALVPFSWRRYDAPPAARVCVTIGHNAFSYKSLRYPGSVDGNVLSLKQWMVPEYDVREKVGLFTPTSVLRWAGSAAAGTRRPQLHFRLGQQALDTIYSSGRLWWLGYVVVMVGYRHD